MPAAHIEPQMVPPEQAGDQRRLDAGLREGLPHPDQRHACAGAPADDDCDAPAVEMLEGAGTQRRKHVGVDPLRAVHER